MDNPKIAVSDEGFSTGKTNLSWGEIKEIVAFKLDLLTIDEIRFAFRTTENPAYEWVEVSEEQTGFEKLISELEIRYPSVCGWRNHVVQPAFEENRTQLFVADD